MAKKYFNLDDKSLWQKSASYNRLKGKRVPVIEKGEKKYIEVKEGIKGYLTFVLSQNKKNELGRNKNKESSKTKQEQQEMEEQQIAPEDKDEYIPQDMEFGESEKEGPYIFQISPALLGYYNSGKKSYFDKKRLIWSKKKKLNSLKLTIDKSQNKHLFKGRLKRGVFSIPLPKGALPDINSLVASGTIKPEFQIDQNNCIYLESNSVQEIAFEFYTSQNIIDNPPIPDDKEKIIKGKLTSQTKSLIKQLRTSSVSPLDKGKSIAKYIQTHKTYNEKKQGEIFKKSNNKNYFYNLDKSESLECLSSNTLLVGLCRELGIASRLVVGHYIDRISKEGNSNLGRNTGHAWTEIWDENESKWIRLDATPPKIQNGEENEEQGENKGEEGNKEGKKNKEEKGEQENDKTEKEKKEEKEEKEDKNKKGEKNDEKSGDGDKENDEGEENNEQSKENSEQGNKNEGGESGDKTNQSQEETPEENKSPQEALEEMIEQIQNENFEKQKEQLEKEKQDIRNSFTSQDAKEKLEKSKLTEKAKEILEEEANQKMLELEKEKLVKSEDENEVDNTVENSNIDNPQYQKLLKKYAELIKRKIKEERKKEEIRMRNFGFSPEEMRLYKKYLVLEKEVRPEIKKNIKALEKILPKEYKMVEEGHFFSGKRLDKRKLVKYAVNKDSRIFVRHQEKVKDVKVNMYETIIIDRSGSMGTIDEIGSPMREAIKAAIIRAKTLEHFKVDFSIIIFDDNIEEIMEFGEKFTAKRTKIPAKLMRALEKSGGTNISAPLLYAQANMKKYSKKQGKKAVGNITFIGDGKPYGGITGDELVNIIKTIKKQFPITAFYISEYSQNGEELERYFGTAESGGTVIIHTISELSKGIINTFNKNIKGILKKIQRKNM